MELGISTGGDVA